MEKKYTLNLSIKGDNFEILYDDLNKLSIEDLYEKLQSLANLFIIGKKKHER